MNLANLDNAQLMALRDKLEEDPANKNTRTDSIWKYTAKTHKALDNINLQITHNMREAKRARGEYVDDSGYSGRKQKKRR